MTNVQLPPIFTQEEQEQNEVCKQRFFDLVASKQALLVVGAGSSAFVGHATWSKLLEKLEETANSCGDDFSSAENKKRADPLSYAQDIRDYIEITGNLTKYYNLIEKEYSRRDPPCDDFHRSIVTLPFKGILTTNYDRVLEFALAEREPQNAGDNSLIISEKNPRQVSEFFLSLDNHGDYPRRIAHLHGRHDDHDSIILTLNDYKKYYDIAPVEYIPNIKETVQSWSFHRMILWSILATRRVVFIGFSCDDPYFNTMLCYVCRDLWRWEESIHYAIMNINQQKAEDSKVKAAKLLKDYGVCVVFYEDFNDSHFGLKKIVEEMKEKCHLGPGSVWMDEVTKQMIKRVKRR